MAVSARRSRSPWLGVFQRWSLARLLRLQKALRRSPATWPTDSSVLFPRPLSTPDGIPLRFVWFCCIVNTRTVRRLQRTIRITDDAGAVSNFARDHLAWKDSAV